MRPFDKLRANGTRWLALRFDFRSFTGLALTTHPFVLTWAELVEAPPVRAEPFQCARSARRNAAVALSVPTSQPFQLRKVKSL